ncbi:MAG: AraC family transcriptional regulator [Alphaproteobacteria bacterium]
MTGIEFFTSTPCLAFVLSGTETFTSFDDQQFTLEQHEMLFMPKNIFLISDFVRTNGPLEAFLFFFDQDTIEFFLKATTNRPETSAQELLPYKVTKNKNITSYMNALNNVYRNINGTPDLLRTKLLELLFLIDTKDENDNLISFLTNAKENNAKRSISHLMREYRCHNLSVQDFAELTGRSLSSFNRDFKRQFGTTPHQWLIDARLDRAMKLIQSTQMNVTEIALEVGYDNVSHFIKAFKTKYGQTPKQARSKIFC